MKRLAVALLVVAVFGCSGKTGNEEPRPITNESGCSPGDASASGDAVAYYSSGSNWAGDLEQFYAYADGHVEVTRTLQDVDSGAYGPQKKTIQIGPAAVTSLLDELAATGVTPAQEGCYFPEERVIDGGGYGMGFQRNGASHSFVVAGGATPAAVDRLYERMTKELQTLEAQP